MPDPSFVLLMQHLQHGPPAITRSAPSGLSGASTADYTRYVEKQEHRFDELIKAGQALRVALWSRLQDGTLELSTSALNDIVDVGDQTLEVEARTLRRLEKKARRNEDELTGREKTEVERAHHRLIAVARRFYEDKVDFGVFLRALRAEVERQYVGERPSPSFSDPSELRRFLMT